LSDRELDARGLERADIPRAVLAAFNGIRVVSRFE